MVDAMVALTLADALMMHHAQYNLLADLLPVDGAVGPLGKHTEPVVPAPPPKRAFAPSGARKGPRDVYAEEN